MRLTFLLCLFLLLACEGESTRQNDTEEVTAAYDKSKWLAREGDDYLHRAEMLNTVLYNDSLRSLPESGVLNMLGDPDRRQDGHLYYKIEENRTFGWTLHATYLVVKLTDDGKVEWIKVHE